MSADGGAGGGPPRLASLAMYRDPPVVAAATRTLWTYLRDRLCAGGLADVPDALDETVAYDTAWLDPRLLFAQACGHPFASRLRGRVRLVATPVYDHPGCIGAFGGSYVIVRHDASVRSLADVRGGIAVINDWGSNSGMNALRHAIAPHAGGGRHFARVIESGGHIASIALIAAGTADVAAVDCVTFGNLARHAPDQVAGVRILAETVKTPALPFITRGSASDVEVALLRAALTDFIGDPALLGVRDVLGLRDIALLADSAYESTLAAEREAAGQGYPILA